MKGMDGGYSVYIWLVVTNSDAGHGWGIYIWLVVTNSDAGHGWEILSIYLVGCNQLLN